MADVSFYLIPPRDLIPNTVVSTPHRCINSEGRIAWSIEMFDLCASLSSLTAGLELLSFRFMLNYHHNNGYTQTREVELADEFDTLNVSRV